MVSMFFVTMFSPLTPNCLMKSCFWFFPTPIEIPMSRLNHPFRWVPRKRTIQIINPFDHRFIYVHLKPKQENLQPSSTSSCTLKEPSAAPWNDRRRLHPHPGSHWHHVGGAGSDHLRSSGLRRHGGWDGPGSHGPWDGLHMNHEKWPTKWRGLLFWKTFILDFGCYKFSIALGESTSRLQKVVTWVTWTNSNGDVRAIKWCREWKMEDLWVNQLVKGTFMWTHIWQIWWGPMSCAAKRIHTYIHTYIHIYIYIYYLHIYMCICIYKYKYINILSCSCLLALGIENYFLDRRTDPRIFGTDYPRISRLFARHLSDVNPDRSHIESAWNDTRPGKHTKNYGKSPSLIGKSTISMGHF